MWKQKLTIPVNVGLLVCVALPIFPKFLPKQHDPVVKHFAQEACKFKGVDMKSAKLVSSLAKIDRESGEAIGEVIITDDFYKKILTFQAQKRHFVWFYNDVVLVDSKPVLINVTPFDDPVGQWNFKTISKYVAAGSFVILICRLVR
jgi:hypothetical protein